MGNTIKQIYASLELCETEIKILVGEFFNTRFNIIRADRYPTDAISDFKIIDAEKLSQDIKKAVDNSSEKIGSSIEQVILVLPPYNFKRFPLRSKVLIENRIIKKEDIARAISNSLKTQIDNDVMVIDAVIIKYTANGIVTRRLPENEVCDELYVDIDLLCADREMCYEYVSVIENSGIKVLDITLGNYAAAKEASLFEESLSRNILLMDVNLSCSYLSVLSKGKLASTEILFDGLNSIINKVYRDLSLPYNDIPKLVKYSLNYESEYPDDVIYAYNSQGTTKTISTKELNECAEKPLNDLIDKLLLMCKPVIDSGALIYLTGEAEQMKAFHKLLEEKASQKIKTYHPETIGIRNSAYASVYGAFFVYRDKALLNNLNVNCIDMLTYEKLIDQKELDTEGETITTKIKNLFKQYMEKGGTINDK